MREEQPRTAAHELITMTWSEYQRGECRYRGQIVRLQRKQAELLALLLLRRGQVVSDVEIVAYLATRLRNASSTAINSVRMNVSRLNRMMPGLIIRHRGGYEIVAPHTAS